MAEALQLTISQTFTESVARLPHKVASRAWAFLRDFPKDPRSPSYHLEKLHAKGMHSARLSDSHRVILSLHGTIAVVLWADEHDPAYRWAERHRLKVSPETGLQLVRVDLEQPKQTLEQKRPADEPGRLFMRWTDDELRGAGVDEHQLPLIRRLDTDENFEELCPHLPEALAERLLDLLYPAEVVEKTPSALAPVELDEAAPIPQEILDHPETRRAFYVAENEEDLERVLKEPLSVWRIFLHPAQQQVVQAQMDGPGLVTGGAGTGKTVVALHRARHLARDVFPDGKILLTTFSRTLADNLQQLINGLCGEERERIEVINLHRWCVRELSHAGHRPNIATTSHCERLLEEVLEDLEVDLPLSFVQDEIRDVIETLDLASFADYATAQRVGRGRRLSRSERKKIWEAFETYQKRLASSQQTDFLQMVRSCRQLVVSGKIKTRYASVIIDEAQDFHAQELRLLQALVPQAENSLLIMGDGRQRIYPGGYSLDKIGIDVEGRVFSLRRNYRNTAQILAAAAAVLEGGQADGLQGVAEQSQSMTLYFGERPKLYLETNATAATARACEVVEAIRDGSLGPGPIEPEEIAVFAVSNTTLENSLSPALQARGIDVHLLKGNADEEDPNGVCLATMHRAKGLEFKACVVVGIGANEFPPSFISKIQDEQKRQEETERYRRLLHVAMSRARDVLVLVGVGEVSGMLQSDGFEQAHAGTIRS